MTEESARQSASGTPVAFIAASAGGVDALRRFFANVPDSPGVAFVVMLHEPPSGSSNLAEIIQRSTPIQVTEIDGRVELEPDCVYVAPPSGTLEFRGSEVELALPASGRVINRADEMLRSLARAKGERAVCVILSGSGEDGALGLVDIHQYGGVVIAQDEAQAQFEGMPASAAATGLVDSVLPVEKIPAEITGYAVEWRESTAGEIELIDDEFISRVLQLLNHNRGRNFEGYKRGTVGRRILRRMKLNRIDSREGYLKLLEENPAESSHLQRDLLISVTQFFRDAEAFSYLESEIIPEVCDRTVTDRPVRVWVAGTATGEEAYSIAMLVAEELERNGSRRGARVFATDLDANALAVARAGVYSRGIDADVRPEWLTKYFVREGDAYRVNTRLREMVTFAEQDVISDPPFSRIDLVVCRNLMIYIDPHLQHRVAAQFYFALNLQGMLFLGSSETMTKEMLEWFRPVSEKFRVYRRISGARRPPARTQLTLSDKLGAGLRPEGRVGASTISEAIERSALDALPVCSVVVNKEMTIHYTSGDTRPFLSLREGQPDINLMSMLHVGLRRSVRSLARQIIEDGEQRAEAAVRMRFNSTFRMVRVIALPLQSDSRLDGLFHFIFEIGQELPSAAQEDREADTDLAELERELSVTRDELYETVEQLEIANEELRASNEEILSVNEELQSMNEELESSKEELQSINEELSSVNRQMQEKLNELQAAHDDVANLLANTEIGTVFLDRDLCIKRFSRSAAAVLNLIDADIGRPFGQIANEFRTVDIAAMASEVLRTAAGDEVTARGPDSKDFIIKVAPYRTEANEVAGVNISLSDVTAIQRAVRQQSMLVELGRMVADRAPLERLFQRAAELLAEGANVQFTKVLQLSEDGGHLRLRAGVGWRAGSVGNATEPAGRGSQAGYTIEIGSPVVVSDIQNESRFVFPELLRSHGLRAGMTVLIAGYEGHPFGVLGAHSPTPRDFTDDDVSFISSIGAFLGSVVATAREMELRAEAEALLRELASDLERRVNDRTRQLKMLGAQALRAEEHERRRIAEGLHDDVQQLLAASHYGLQSLLERPNEITQNDLEDVARWVEQALASTRSFVFDLSPTVLYEEGLGTALAHLAAQMEERHGLSVEVDQKGGGESLPQDVRVFLYSATRELLFNVVKHANVDEATVELTRENGIVRVMVRDEGRGIVPTEERTSGSGVGLASLQERIQGMGGEMSVDSSPGKGTAVTLSLPLANRSGEPT